MQEIVLAYALQWLWQLFVILPVWCNSASFSVHAGWLSISHLCLSQSHHFISNVCMCVFFHELQWQRPLWGFFFLVPGVATLSVSLRPLSFSSLSALIPASVHSTSLMVRVIYSDSFTATHLFVLEDVCLPCVSSGKARKRKEKENWKDAS